MSGHRQKIVAATQVWLYLKNELMEQTDILHADVNFRKLKVASVVFVCVCVLSKIGVDLYFMGRFLYLTTLLNYTQE